jgi:hypothetical protein
MGMASAMTLPNAIQGSLRPSLLITWYETGTTSPVDLTGATLSGFIQSGSTTVPIAGTLTVTDTVIEEKHPEFRWDLAAADVAEAGKVLVQFVATYASSPTPAKTFVMGWLVERALVA